MDRKRKGEKDGKVDMREKGKMKGYTEGTRGREEGGERKVIRRERVTNCRGNGVFILLYSGGVRVISFYYGHFPFVYVSCTHPPPPSPSPWFPFIPHFPPSPFPHPLLPHFSRNYCCWRVTTTKVAIVAVRTAPSPPLPIPDLLPPPSSLLPNPPEGQQSTRMPPSPSHPPNPPIPLPSPLTPTLTLLYAVQCTVYDIQ